MGMQNHVGGRCLVAHSPPGRARLCHGVSAPTLLFAQPAQPNSHGTCRLLSPSLAMMSRALALAVCLAAVAGAAAQTFSCASLPPNWGSDQDNNDNGPWTDLTSDPSAAVISQIWNTFTSRYGSKAIPNWTTCSASEMTNSSVGCQQVGAPAAAARRLHSARRGSGARAPAPQPPQRPPLPTPCRTSKLASLPPKRVPFPATHPPPPT